MCRCSRNIIVFLAYGGSVCGILTQLIIPAVPAWAEAEVSESTPVVVEVPAEPEPEEMIEVAPESGLESEIILEPIVVESEVMASEQTEEVVEDEILASDSDEDVTSADQGDAGLQSEEGNAENVGEENVVKEEAVATDDDSATATSTDSEVVLIIETDFGTSTENESGESTASSDTVLEEVIGTSTDSLAVDDVDSDGFGGGNSSADSDSDFESEDTAATATATASTTNGVVNDQSENATNTKAVVTENDTVVEESEVVDEVSDTDTVAADENDSIQSEVAGLATSTDELDIATSSEGSVNEITEDIVINDANRHQFGVGECVAVGDGSYYCTKGLDLGQAEIPDALEALQDKDGDLEIYFTKDGERSKITNNTLNDAAPYYDAQSDRIVWHRLIDGRYQIIVYDVATAKETQVTDTSYNNMEPTIAGDVMVWQAWVDTNWEVFVYKNNVISQITDNDVHDVAPHIRAGYVVWQTQEKNGEGQVVVYDLETGTAEMIDEDAGATVKNPRFVLVYDSALENGDVITRGYDLDAGEVIDLAALPVELPEEIPDAEPTEAVRAIIQKPILEDEEVDVDLDTETNDGVDSGVAVNDGLDQNVIATTTEPINDPVVEESDTWSDSVVVLVEEVDTEVASSTDEVDENDEVGLETGVGETASSSDGVLDVPQVAEEAVLNSDFEPATSTATVIEDIDTEQGEELSVDTGVNEDIATLVGSEDVELEDVLIKGDDIVIVAPAADTSHIEDIIIPNTNTGS